MVYFLFLIFVFTGSIPLSTTRKPQLMGLFRFYTLKYTHNSHHRNRMEQTERIKRMEQQFNKSASALMQLSAALDQLQASQEAIKELSDYYGSETWKQDFADDESGRLPQDLQRGVLSEDAIWNLLEDYRELKLRMQSFVDIQ